MRYYSNKSDWSKFEGSLGNFDDMNWGKVKPFVKKLEKLEQLLASEPGFYSKPNIIYTDAYASTLDTAIDTLRDGVAKKGHQELVQRVDDKATAGFKNVQELLEYVNGKEHEYVSTNEHTVLNQHIPVAANGTERRKATFNEIFGTLSAGNPEVTRYYTLEKNRQLSQIKRNKTLSDADRAKRLQELENSDGNRQLYENFLTIFPETYVYPLTQKELDRLRKEAEEAERKARDEAMKKVGWQIFEAVAMVAVACLVPGGALIVAGYVAGKMAVTALNGNVDPVSGEKVDAAGYGMMALDMIPGLGALGKIGKASKVASVIGKIANSSQKAEKVIAATSKAFTAVSKFGTKALKVYDNPVTQMGIAAYQSNCDPTSIVLAGAGMSSTLGNKMRQSQKIANVLAKTPKAVQAVAKTVGKGYDRVSAAATKISNKIDDISAKSRNSISNLFNKTTSKIGSKIDDIGLKARSLNLKHAEVPSLAMAGGGNAGRPVKVPIGVGINEKKLEKLRQMKVEKNLDKSFRKFNPETATSIQKGNYGEYISHKTLVNMKELEIDGVKRPVDLERISTKSVADLDAPTAKGIDGIYRNREFPPPPQFIINEAKFGKSRLRNTKTMGRQMSEEWIERNLLEEFGEENLLGRKILQSIENGETLSLVSKVDKVGNTQFQAVQPNGYINQRTRIEGV